MVLNQRALRWSRELKGQLRGTQKAGDARDRLRYTANQSTQKDQRIQYRKWMCMGIPLTSGLLYHLVITYCVSEFDVFSRERARPKSRTVRSHSLVRARLEGFRSRWITWRTRLIGTRSGFAYLHSSTPHNTLNWHSVQGSNSRVPGLDRFWFKCRCSVADEKKLEKITKVTSE